MQNVLWSVTTVFHEREPLTSTGSRKGPCPLETVGLYTVTVIGLNIPVLIIIMVIHTYAVIITGFQSVSAFRNYYGAFLDAFAEFRKTTISSVISVLPFSRNNSAPTE
jgi:hypothetical protein